MLTRLRRALLGVFPVVLLVVVGLLAAVFRRRRGPRTAEAALVPAPATPPVPPVRRRWAAIALLALLVGTGSILAVVNGDRGLMRRVLPLPSTDGAGSRPVTALSQADSDAGTGNAAAAVAPDGQGAATVSGPKAPSAPTFETVRVEPNGELVVAGRAPPNGTVELLVDGKATARVVADANGQFAVVPPPLPAGNSEVGLRVTDGRGSVRQSRDSVAVMVSPSGDAKPLVAVTSPDKPTVVLSQPGPLQTATRPVPDATSLRRTLAGTASPGRRGSGEVVPDRGASNAAAAGDATRSSQTGSGGHAGAGGADQATSNGAANSSGLPEVQPSRGTLADGAPTKIVSVDVQDGGRLFVTGQAAAGATLRLYLNDTLIASAGVGRDGTASFTVGRGVKPGDYKVRLDQVDAASGKVRSRVEVPLSVPDAARIAGADRSVAAPPETAPNGDGGATVAPNTAQPMASAPTTVPRQGRMVGASDGPRDPMSKTPAPPASAETVRDPSGPHGSPAAVFVPEIRTARIERGDSLWAISRRTYGEGDRYTAIYDANQDQIRDPDLIYPGQVFVLPSEDAIDAAPEGKRG